MTTEDDDPVELQERLGQAKSLGYQVTLRQPWNMARRCIRRLWMRLPSGLTGISPITVCPDTSMISAKGKVLFFGVDRFVRDIAEGSNCFLCGKSYKKSEFNGEHVIPNWLLRKHALHSQRFNVPAGNSIKYSTYMTPCCKDCNSWLGDRYEKPISSAFLQGYDSLSKYVGENGTWDLFVWLSLIFLKTHLKDRELKVDLKSRDDVRIGEGYDWVALHHVHCVARSGFAETTMMPATHGSLFLAPLKCVKDDYFDFYDNYDGRVIGICSGNAAVVAVLNDACGVFSVFREELMSVNAPLTQLQFRELCAHFANINNHLCERPEFYTKIGGPSGDTVMDAIVPQQVSLREEANAAFRELHLHACLDIVKRARWNEPWTAESVADEMRAGRMRFLIGDGRKFHEQQVVLLPDSQQSDLPSNQ